MAIRLIYRQMKQLQLLAWKPKWSAASACRTCQFRPLYRPYETLATSKGINGSTLHISSILGDHLKVGSGIGEPAMLLVANLFGPFHMFIPPIALKVAPKSGIAKSPTGITGLDQITEGGLPQGRPTLLCGTAGCGKTILAMEFLIRGATEFQASSPSEHSGSRFSRQCGTLGVNYGQKYRSTSDRLPSRRA